MARTTFEGPVVSRNGFVNEGPAGSGLAGPSITFQFRTTATLPAAASVPAGTVMMVSDNGVGNNEMCLVISTGAAWMTCTGQALT